MPYGPNTHAPSGGYGTARPLSAGGPPPVTKRRQSFVTTDEDELRLLKAATRARQRALAKRRSKARKQGLAQAGGSPVFDSRALIAALAPQPPTLPPIIDPTQKVMAGLAADVQSAQGAAKRGLSEAQGAIPEGADTVSGAGLQDTYAGAMGGLESAQFGIRGQVMPELAEFVLKQMQDRVGAQQQYQQDLGQYQRGLMASPSQVAQLASMGLLGKVDLSDPYAVAAVLQQGGGAREISPSLRAQLTLSGIDWKQYQFDEYGARVALGEKKKTGGLSDEDLIAAIRGI